MIPDLPSCTIQKVPNKVISMALGEIFRNVPESVKDEARKLVQQGWKFYVADQVGGWCLMSQRTIVLPWSVWKTERWDYRTYYIAHEMAHAFDHCRSNHGPSFMEWFVRICPIGDQHYEYEYKPRNARRAGVSVVGSL